MICFFQRSEKHPFVKLGTIGNPIKINSVYKDNNPRLNEIYFSSVSTLNNYYSFLEREYKDEINLFNVDLNKIDVKLPFILGNSTELGRTDIELIEGLKAIYKDKKKKLKIAISLFDVKNIGFSMLTMSVIACLIEELKTLKIENEITLLITPELYPYISELKDYFNLSVKIKTDPITLSELQFYDFLLITKNNDFENNENLDYIDLICNNLNYKMNKNIYNKIKIELPLTEMEYSQSLIKNYLKNKNPIVYFNKDAGNKNRTMSNEKATELIQALIDNDYNVMVFDELNDIEIDHDNFLNVSIFSTTIFNLATFINAADYSISVDSAPLHISKFLNKTAIGIFTTIKPETRIKYYYNCEPIYLENNWEDLNAKDFIKIVKKQFKKSFF